MHTLSTQDNQSIETIAKLLHVPDKDSHKGQNGKLLVIGGSELFHAPLVWSAEVASHIVDMVHVASPYTLNNQLMELRLKQRFFNGIVIPWEQVEDYLQEDDCVLIGPGMTRSAETKTIVNTFLTRYATKQWVVDGGALQEVEPQLLCGQMIVTPHQKEWKRVTGKLDKEVIVLLKGPTDVITHGEERVEI